VFDKLFRLKSVDNLLSEANTEGKRLKRVLGPVDVTMVGIGAIIGAGIFATVGEATVGASSGFPAGPAVVFSFVLTALACGFAALCYAEMAAMVPISGSAYTYSYATMGEFIAWIIGWDLIIEYAIGNVAVAISWSGYFNDLIKITLGIDIPIWLRTDFRTFIDKGMALDSVPHIFNIPIVFNFPAVAIVALLTVILVIGIKESSRFNTLLVIFKILILAIFIGIGFYFFNPLNWVPFAPGGWHGILKGASIAFFAYIGFDAVSTVAEETRNPKKDMPTGIIGSLIICTVIYVLVAIALTGMIPYELLRNKITEPLVAGLEYNNVSGWVVALIAFGSVVASTAVLLVFQMGQPRIFFAMSRDGLLPKSFAKVHPKFKTPHVTTIWTGVVVAFLSAFCNLDEIVNLCNIGTLFAFILVCAGVLILRYKDPQRIRPFKAPGGIFTPILGIGFCVLLITGLDKVTWIRFLGWLILGLLIYVFYGFKKSKLANGV